MEPPRHSIVDTFKKYLNNDVKAANFEKACYNSVIRNAKKQKIICKWENKNFMLMYKNKIKSMLFNINKNNNAYLHDCIQKNKIKITDIPFLAYQELSPERWKEIVDTNLTGVFNCCRAALPWLKKSEGADIVNMGSRSGRYSFRGGVGYNTTKFGLQGFTEALFLDLHQYGIRVSLVAPGIVATGFAGATEEDWHISPKDVAKVVGDIIASDARAAVNWVEIRPARPQ